MKRLKTLLPIFIVIIALTACDDDDNNNGKNIDVNQELLNLMDSYYLWYNQMPVVNPQDYSNPAELMDALRVNPPDKWSYVTTRAEFEAYYNQAAYVGFGFGSGFDADGNLYISFVFKSSPLAAEGVGRGWQILTIDGETPTTNNYSDLIGASEVGVSKTFVFKSPGGENYEYTFTKNEISMNTVLFDSVYTYGTSKVGYFVLESFIDKTKEELNTVFSNFKSAGVNELIVDLRYNGGGEVIVSKYLANLIGGSVAFGKVYATSAHNDKHSDLNCSYLFSAESNSLSLNRVIFITTSGTASASELVINGLKPFMDVALVGKNTHGKPVGMYIFTFNDPDIDWAFVPVCFSMYNANNEGDYYNGLQVTVAANDDILVPFGDTDESSLNASLSYLGVTTKGNTAKSIKPFHSIVGKGLKAEIGAW